MKSFGLLLVALLFFGCAPTIADIRQTKPSHILISDKNPKELANCIAYESQAALDYWNRFWDPAKIIEINGTYKILITLTAGLFVTTFQPMAELIITPANSGSSKVECRIFSHWGGKEQFWNLVQKCAGHEQTSQNIPGK